MQLSYKMIPAVGTAIFTLIIVSVFVYVLTVKLRKKREERQFDKQLKFSINPDDGSHDDEKKSFIQTQLNVLPDLFIRAGLVKETTSKADLLRRILLVGSFIFTIALIVTQNPLGGILPVLFLYIVARVFAVFKISRIKSLMNEQIPAFVSTFKANIQANQHAQNAMINAIDNTADPLYSELARAKSIMEAGDFQSGIINLRMNTENDTLRQMASCIELASASGSNIEEQIEIIEDIIEDKQMIARKKRLGVNENKPLFFIAALMVPVSFVGSYFMSDMHREYWFTTTTSYLILIGVIILMLISSWGTWKVIQRVDID